MVQHVYSVINGTNGARMMSVGKVIPKDWENFIIEQVILRTLPKRASIDTIYLTKSLFEGEYVLVILKRVKVT